MNLSPLLFIEISHADFNSVLFERMRLLSAEIRVNATKENNEQQLVATVLNHCIAGKEAFWNVLDDTFR